MERPQQKSLKLDNSPKVLRRDIELLPNEILLNIFSNLSIKELLKCAQVSKKFRQISHDGSFWKCVNLYNQRVSCQFVAQLLHLGTEYLNLLGTTKEVHGSFRLGQQLVKKHGVTKIGVFCPLFCVGMLGKSTNYSTGTWPLHSTF